ncbi:DEAD/DEAH box helicase family protein [uncultured Phascolarctobacterium sp.]|uniref:DEAD/DEAH box helicase family protein n=1 Tax=uncultured Phascolarctobacterium sp. TaxID=512296 RepID=UPI0025D2B2F1|nr:DEAD/DEAH box helicase family protein [uncultured Phascolarctobacterium sp.]
MPARKGFTRFNEDTRVKIPATLHFLRIGYQYQSLKDADIDFNTKIFVNRFKTAIEKINGKSFCDLEIKQLLDAIHDIIRSNDMGKAFYRWLVDPNDKVKLIDLDNWENNDFAVVDELPFTISEDSEVGSFRPDINILINGMPLAFLEVKKPNNEGGIQEEFKRMVGKRLQNAEYTKFFNLIQLVTFSNNMEYEEADDAEDVKAGSFYSTPNGQSTSFSFFREDSQAYHLNYPYKEIDDDTIRYVIKDCGYNPAEADTPEFQENYKTTTPCNSFITSFFDKERVIYMLKFGIAYIDDKVPQKHIMRYPQFFATRKIIERIDKGGHSGIIWHTQGSGKTALAAFATHVLKDYFAKKNINPRFFFVVDRLDLLTQSSNEFTKRGLDVINCESRAQFTAELQKPLSTATKADALGEICVVNIQKFESDIPQAKNEYGANVQRVFFIDEAHRSYASTGEFFKNLMTCDTDAIYIALTGTPLLTKKERSNLKFGDYIHKYFYDKSIADGYTLRIKKENIDTVAKKEIKQNLCIEDGKLDDKDVYESESYIRCLCPFIERDFKHFRLENLDDTIGGMVVCRSNLQAKKVQEWFEKNSKLSTGLVISDYGDPAQREKNKTYQTDFRESYVPDMLIVNFMLTTGYDVSRLKKMYLLRGPHAQSLLQTISRVNRPYKSPKGKVYRYGYIVDFIDIEQEYESTINAYIKELEKDMEGDEDGSLAGLVVDKEDIKRKYDGYISELDDMMLDLDNLARFAKMITMFNKDTLLKVRRLLNGIKECRTEFVLSKADEYIKLIDSDKLKKQARTVQERIDFLNLSTNTVAMMDLISDKRIVEIIYEFIKTRIEVLDLSKFAPGSPAGEEFKEHVVKIQQEIKRNKDKQDIKMVELDQLLQKIFEKLSIGDIDDIDGINEKLKEALAKAKAINDENDRLAALYGEHFAFAKAYKDASVDYDVDKSDVEKFLCIVYDNLKDVLDTDSIVIQGRQNFIDSIKKDVTKILLKEKLYTKVKGFYDELLGALYTDIQLYR